MAMTRSQRTSWFDALRRDRHAFVLLASLILLLQALQPIAAAAQGANPFSVDCTSIAADDASQTGAPANHQNCAKCLSGLCSMPAVGKILVSAGPAWVKPGELAGFRWPLDRTLNPPPAGQRPPPSIRAPPLSI